MIHNFTIRDHAAFGKGFVEYALEKRDFGTMNKVDYEVLIFYLLQREMSGMSDFDISRALCIPSSKVSKLRYEADLRYGKRELSEEELRKKASEMILQAQIDGTTGRIVFSVPDQYMRHFIQSELKKTGFFADTSFNRELVSVNARAYAELLECLCFNKADIKRLNSRAKQTIQDDKAETVSWKSLFVHMVDGAAKQIGKNAIDALFGGAPLVSNVVDWLYDKLFK